MAGQPPLAGGPRSPVMAVAMVQASAIDQI